VAALSSQNTLPEPTLDLDTLQPGSTFTPSTAKYNRTNSNKGPVSGFTDDPWGSSGGTRIPATPGFDSGSIANAGAPSVFSGSGLPQDWWTKQDSATVTILGQQGFILNRYTVYEVRTNVRIKSANENPTNYLPDRKENQSFGVIQSSASCGTVW
jgi:sorting nexin-8